MYRRKSGLSQQEVAFLLGCQNSAKVSRYERRTRRPRLETVFACEIIFGIQASELFAGILERARRSVRRRAKRLVARMAKSDDRQNEEAIQVLLLSLANAPSQQLRYTSVSRP
jgi:transcriptional regulator with XRE-family HTH domain